MEKENDLFKDPRTKWLSGCQTNYGSWEGRVWEGSIVGGEEQLPISGKEVSLLTFSFMVS